jgi:hypothetical protein
MYIIYNVIFNKKIKLGLNCYVFIALLGLLLIPELLFSQDTPIGPSIIIHGQYLGETPPLSSLPVMTEADWTIMKAKAEAKANKPRDDERLYENLANIYQGQDPLVQQSNRAASASASILHNFAGTNSPYYPSDANGCIGPDYYMQTINCVYTIFNSSGTIVAGPTNMNILFSGVTGSTYNDGDPIVLYDEQAQRWLAAEFSISGNNDYMLVAVSTTSDPTGTWNKYSFDVDDMPDYMKFGVWRDGYYMATNNTSGNDVYVFERDVMLAGGASPRMIGFDNPNRPNSGFHCIMPLDNDGAFAPASTPGLFITINDDAWGGSDQLWIYQLVTNWSVPSSSTFGRVQQIDVASFDSYFGSNWNDITQLGTTQKLDAVPQVLMNVPQFRDFDDNQHIVACHTVDVDGTARGGIRWYELQRPSGTSGSWSIRQQGTYDPGISSRWMGSIRMNGNKQIGLGYSIAGNMYPGIRITGQSAAEYVSASGIMDVTEGNIQNGVTYQSTYNRWGDYAGMQVDPVNDKTFWFTTQYTGAGGSRSTKIAAFDIAGAPVVVTNAATNLNTVNQTATINGSINPLGLSATYYFEWGTTTSYGIETSHTSAGSGSTAVDVYANLSSLIPGIIYHYRLVGNNLEGTSYGEDKTFALGAPQVTTAAVSSITATTAVCGGNVISEGGGTNVIARGVCWSTAVDPTISNSKTVDGSGLGSFTSNITSLTGNTTYFVRAYATNASGTTSYGENVQFTTTCSDFFTVPFTEDFAEGTLPNCWAAESLTPGNISWQFGTAETGGLTTTTPPYAYVRYAIAGTGTANLITPAFNFSGYTNIRVKFAYRAYNSSSKTFAYAEYSLDGGANWVAFLTVTTADIETVFDQVIPALSDQSNVKIRWRRYVNNSGFISTFSIDDLEITGIDLFDCPSYSLPFSEGFNNSNIRPTCWEESGSSSWTFVSSTAGNKTTIYPISDPYFALLVRTDAGSTINKLITPKFDLSDFISATLDFHHQQQSRKIGATYYTDQLKVYYKTSLDGTWNLLDAYSGALSNWTLHTMVIDPTTFTNDYYLAFEGNLSGGYGVCLEDINITGVLFTPTAFNVTGGGSYCEGGFGVPVGLDGSQNGVVYTLYLDGAPLSPTIDGTGSAISFGNQNSAGTYTVKGKKGNITDMTGSATVSINPLPTPTISGPTWVGAGQSGAIYTTESGMNTYTWSIVGGTIVSGDETNSIIVNWGGAGTGWVYVNCITSGGCTAQAPVSVRVDIENKRSDQNDNWNLAETWWPTGVPTSTENIEIKHDVTVESSPEALCKDLTITSGSVLINPQKALTVFGTITNNLGASGLIIKSDATGTGSLINSTPGVLATVERYIDNSGTLSWDWHMLSSPLEAQPIWTNFVPTAPNWNVMDDWDFYYYNPNTPYATGHTPWVNIKNVDGTYNNGVFDKEGDDAGFGPQNPVPGMKVGRGYLVGFNNTYLSNYGTTRVFTGSALNAGQISLHVANAADLYNMAGNPYPSAIDWKASTGWTRALLSGGTSLFDYWIYNEDYGNYGVFNSGGSDESGTNGVTRYVAPGQAFFVKAAATSASSRDLIIMNDNVRVHNTQPWLKSSETANNVLRLKLTTEQNTFSDEMIIEFNSDFSGDEGSDKFYSLQQTAPEIWSVKNEKFYSINRYKEVTDNLTVNISAKCGVAGNYSIKALNIDNFTLCRKIYLDDLKTGNIINLKDNNSYYFSGNPDDDRERFRLTFAQPIGLEELESIRPVYLFCFEKDVFINAAKLNIGNCEVFVYDASGRMVYQGGYHPVEGNTKLCTLKFPGVYIVKVISSSGTISDKIVIP